MCWIELVIQQAPEHSRVTGEGEAPASTEDLSESDGAAHNVYNRPNPCPWESLSCVERKVTIVITALIPPSPQQSCTRILLYLFCFNLAPDFSWPGMMTANPNLQLCREIRNRSLLAISVGLYLNIVHKSHCYHFQIGRVLEQRGSHCCLRFKMWSKPQNVHFHQ